MLRHLKVAKNVKEVPGLVGDVKVVQVGSFGCGPGGEGVVVVVVVVVVAWLECWTADARETAKKIKYVV